MRIKSLAIALFLSVSVQGVKIYQHDLSEMRGSQNSFVQSLAQALPKDSKDSNGKPLNADVDKKVGKISEAESKEMTEGIQTLGTNIEKEY